MTFVMKNQIKAQPFDCMQYFYGAVQEPRIRCLIRFRAPVSETVLKRAVNLSIGAVPPIGCVFDEKRHCWMERGFTAEDIVRLIPVSEEDESDACRYLLNGIDHTSEPQVKLLLLRGKTRDTLCVVINHMICDGAGFKEYLYLLGELYTRCEEDAGFGRRPAPFGRRDLGQLMRNLSLKEELDILHSKSNSDRPDPDMVMPIRGDLSNPMIVMTSIGEERLRAIHSYAKSRRASINDVLLAAYLRALSRATGRRKITIPCPVDLRRFKRADQRCGICNLTGNYICTAEIFPGETFDDTLRKVSDQMRLQKAGFTCLKGPMLYHMMFHMLPFETIRKLFYKVSPVPVTSYTNLGVIDDAKLRFGSSAVEGAFISTAVKKAPYFQLSVSTCRGCCTLTSSLYGAEDDRKWISGFLNAMKSELEGLN